MIEETRIELSTTINCTSNVGSSLMNDELSPSQRVIVGGS